MNETRYREAERTYWGHHGLEPEERFLRLRHTGTRIRVQEVGAGDPVVFIHGGPNAGTTWAPLVEHLTEFRCLLVDRPGTGLSEPWRVTSASLEAFAASFVADVLGALDIDRAHVVASSFGGHIALRSAASSPRRIHRMVQMACPALSPGETLPPFMAWIANPVLRPVIGRMPPNRRAGRSILRQLGHGATLDAGRLDPAFETWSMALQRHTRTHRSDLAMIASVVRARNQLELDARILGAVEAPTRFLWGADDTFGDLGVAHGLAAMMPDADVVAIPQAGHLPWIDAPRRLANETLGFLGESGRSEGVPGQATIPIEEGRDDDRRHVR